MKIPKRFTELLVFENSIPTTSMKKHDLKKVEKLYLSSLGYDLAKKMGYLDEYKRQVLKI